MILSYTTLGNLKRPPSNPPPMPWQEKKLTSQRELLLRHVWPCPATGCWIWLGPMNGSYGIFSGARRRGMAHRAISRDAHRAAWELFRGWIGGPKQLQLDHLCRVTCCVNPYHLDPVTMRENLRRRAESIKQEREWTHRYGPILPIARTSLTPQPDSPVFKIPVLGVREFVEIDMDDEQVKAFRNLD